MTEFICSYCNKEFKHKQSLIKHSDKCTEKILKNKEDNLQKEADDRLKTLTSRYENTIASLNKNHELNLQFLKNNNLETVKTYEDKIKEIVHNYEIRIAKLESVIEINEKRCDDFKQQLEIRNQSVDELAKKAIENTGSKTTITNNRNQIYQALEPLTKEHMIEQVQHLTPACVKNGTHSIAHFASNYTFKGRVMCTDKSRLNFVFKNEENAIIKDPEGVEITKKFIEINRDELLRLLNEYLKAIEDELFKDIGTLEYKHWAEKREEVLAIRSAISNGNYHSNKESYSEFKKGFLSALSDLVPR